MQTRIKKISKLLILADTKWIKHLFTSAIFLISYSNNGFANDAITELNVGE
jgi:hypothetical protein